MSAEGVAGRGLVQCLLSARSEGDLDAHDEKQISLARLTSLTSQALPSNPPPANPALRRQLPYRPSTAGVRDPISLDNIAVYVDLRILTVSYVLNT